MSELKTQVVEETTRQARLEELYLRLDRPARRAALARDAWRRDGTARASGPRTAVHLLKSSTS